jgi:outer membrane biosynthesis protein TonB
MFMPTPRPIRAPRAQPVEPGFQPHSERTRIEGSISNLGPRGIDAIGTPLGRYQKVVKDAVGSRWFFYINRRMDMMTVGTVRIRFFVNEKGKVEDVRMLSNTANDTFAGFSIQSIMDATIPPPPSDVVDVLDGNRLEIVYTFTLYPD